ncbi:MAG: hypothetical protein QXU01_02960 [Candidatus Hadarchaeales archaeon]
MYPLSLLGIVLILLGLAFLIAPIIARYFDVERIPSWLIYVYRSDGFYFVTSPILILISFVLLILHLLEVLR